MAKIEMTPLPPVNADQAPTFGKDDGSLGFVSKMLRQLMFNNYYFDGTKKNPPEIEKDLKELFTSIQGLQGVFKDPDHILPNLIDGIKALNLAYKAYTEVWDRTHFNIPDYAEPKLPGRLREMDQNIIAPTDKSGNIRQTTRPIPISVTNNLPGVPVPQFPTLAPSDTITPAIEFTPLTPPFTGHFRHSTYTCNAVGFSKLLGRLFL